MSIIKIVIGEEVKPKIEKIEDMKNSVFSEVYSKAFSLIDNLCGRDVKENEHTYNIEEYNNIIAFVGDRGSGKTSSMLSVLEALDCFKNEGSIDELKKLNINSSENIKNTRFHCTEIIDPSFFDEKHNILDIVLGKLFKRFKDEYEKDNDKDSGRISDKRDLVDKFQKVKKAIDNLLNPNDSNDSIDNLLAMSSASEIRSKMKSLIDTYLKYINKEDSKNSFLVIPIDDIDLHTKEAYKMVEQIRKYLIQPNVVILLAVKLSQLSDVLIKNFHTELSISKNNDYLSDSFEEMADRYLTKFIPYQNRLYLPEISINLNSSIEIYKNDKLSSRIDENNHKNIGDYITYLINKKTELKFYNISEKIYSTIVPRNFREIVQLLTVFHKMEYIKADDASIIEEFQDQKERRRRNRNRKNQLKKENIKYFKNYFIHTWCKSNLSRDFYKFILELDKTELALKNKKIVRFIDKKFKLTDFLYEHNVYSQSDSFAEIKRIIDFNNYFYKISIGDVVFLLNFIKDKYIEEEYQLFVFASKTMFTFFLEASKREWIEDISNKFNNPREEIITFKTMSNDYPNYLLLVGDSFYNQVEYDNKIGSDIGKFCKIKPDFGLDLEKYNTILNEIRKHNLYKDHLKRVSSKLESSDNNVSKIKNLNHKIHALENVLLFLNNNTLDNYRLIDDGVYNDYIQNPKDLSTFSLISIFTNFLKILQSTIIEYSSVNNGDKFSRTFNTLGIIAREDGTFFNAYFSKLISLYRRNNHLFNEDIKDEIINLIETFGFNSIEEIEFSIVTGIQNISSYFKKTFYNYISNVLFVKNLNSNNELDNKISQLKNLPDLSDVDEMFSVFRDETKKIKIYNQEIEIEDGLIKLDNKDKGLYKAVYNHYYNFLSNNNSYIVEEGSFYSTNSYFKTNIYMKCLREVLKDEKCDYKTISAEKLTKNKILDLFERIDRNIKKFLK
ncbi:MAG: hypothetical protein N4A32_09645 [Marinifilaceae bacterium]|jgi:hypothetical protein|nr:hypothetical protein [Marinifilaceae bacterium]